MLLTLFLQDMLMKSAVDSMFKVGFGVDFGNQFTKFFYLVWQNPLVQEKIACEVRQATNPKDTIPPDEFAELITEEALDKMQYLHATIIETLRLYPAVTLVIPIPDLILIHVVFPLTDLLEAINLKILALMFIFFP
ncbi:Cytochrome P [Parasponia andersonii]|uniref:Cytochrome P n=1 Tax=Parasponia andersonii TaxID=3476 RepID=A0A2P5D9M4_PARAD|nr:Cytochrome P [Parasponia andersonii]